MSTHTGGHLPGAECRPRGVARKWDQGMGKGGSVLKKKSKTRQVEVSSSGNRCGLCHHNYTLRWEVSGGAGTKRELTRDTGERDKCHR